MGTLVVDVGALVVDVGALVVEVGVLVVVGDIVDVAFGVNVLGAAGHCAAPSHLPYLKGLTDFSLHAAKQLFL